MAHEFETGLTVGEKSWHGLETNVQTPVKTVREALAMAGMDWLVDLKPIYRLLDDGSFEQVPGNGVVRLSDNRWLATVGEGFTPVQNATAFDPLQSLIDAGYMSIDSCGSLRGGARVYFNCKLTGEAAEVVKGDHVEGNFLAYQGHDGKLRLGYKHTATRTVCANTLGIATRGDDQAAEGYSRSGVFFAHNSGINTRIETLTQQLKSMAAEFSSGIEAFRDLARKQMHPKAFFETLLGIEERRLKAQEEGKDEPTKGRLTLERLLESYDEQPGRQFAPGSAWQAYNAVTFWTDHKRGRDENRRDNALFGQSAALKQKALVLALAS